MENQNSALPNLEALNATNWTKLQLKNPATFRVMEKPCILRYIRNFKGKIMCELEMDDDKMMADITTLHPTIQKHIDAHIGLNLAPMVPQKETAKPTSKWLHA